MVGLVQEIIDAIYLILSIDGVGVESMKAGGVVVVLLAFRYSVCQS